MKIAARYRPFSHRPGASCLIPSTSHLVRVYPIAFMLQNSLGDEVKYEWNLTGPIKNFTMIQDLEKQEVVVYGIAKEGYFSYRLFYENQAIVLQLERAPVCGLNFLMQGEVKHLQSKAKISLCPAFGVSLSNALEKISFGNHKAQDWDRIHQRSNPLEYIPFWFALGQQVPPKEGLLNQGNYQILANCHKTVEEVNKEGFLESLQKLFAVAFHDVLVPKLYDDEYLGIGTGPDELSCVERPIALLSEGYQLIRKMLFQYEGGKLHILPHLPALFHAGRCLHFRFINNQGKLSALVDLEWSKKFIKKVKITSFEKQTLQFCFQKPLKRFRLRHPLHQRGCEYGCEESIEINQGVYLLDCFKK